jgi:hypothetical protein
MLDTIPLMDWSDLARAAGIAGACTYIASYAALQWRLIGGCGLTYTALNTVAAVLVLTGLSADFNLGSALVQGTWLLLGLCRLCSLRPRPFGTPGTARSDWAALPGQTWRARHMPRSA